MIIAERKPFDEIYNKIEGYDRILVMGCGTCVTVCMAGGEKEAGILANQLRLAAREKNKKLDVQEHTIVRQCDREFFDEQTIKKIQEADATLSMACGVGVQFMSEVMKEAHVYAALNTRFYGATVEQGVWSERCAGCGNCIVDKFGAVCPVARCSKSLLNGPCGGSADGKCEINPDTDCAWQLIFDKMDSLGRLEELTENQPIRDWSSGTHGGPGKVIREDVLIDKSN